MADGATLRLSLWGSNDCPAPKWKWKTLAAVGCSDTCIMHGSVGQYCKTSKRRTRV